ncbi:MAG TPA: hypothetical protein VEC36_10880, partial [Patescibacteria group bacterium]|nr:hypothetical protein [Patescibacteria group bacterium]
AVAHVKGFLGSEDFHSINEQILEFISEHKLNKIVLEIYAIVLPNTSMKIWYIEDFIPRIVQAGLRYAAVIVPRNQISKFVVEEIIKKIKPSQIEIRTFTNVSIAKYAIASIK